MPTIVTRPQWGAREWGLEVYTTPWSSRTGLIVHYSAASKTQTVRAIQDYHLGKGWGDIGYNWLVDVSGRIYEGRKGTWAAVGAHTLNHNTSNIGVCMVGTNADVTEAAKSSIRWLYDEANRLAGRTLAKRYHSGMSGNSTSCPGDNLRNWVLAGMPVYDRVSGPVLRRAWPSYMPANHYFGLITGPDESHGGYYVNERPDVKAIQQRLIVLGYVPGITDPNSGWADGLFEWPTFDAVARWQRAHYAAYTTRYGEVWSDDWQRLFTY